MKAIHTPMTGYREDALPIVTIGTIKSAHEGEIVLVYLNNGEGETLVVRYDRLSPEYRGRVRAIAQDPLSVLERTRPAVH